jgi:hypothetical protein
MTVALRISNHGDVAVLSGVDSEPALTHLARSLVNGDVFADYPALVIDLRTLGELPRRVVDELADAQEACLHRHQLLAVVRPDQTVPIVIGEARRWLRIVGDAPAHPRLDAVTAQTRMATGTAAALARALLSVALWPARRLRG